MFYKNSQNCEVQSVLFSYSGEPRATRLFWPSWRELRGPAGSVSIN